MMKRIKIWTAALMLLLAFLTAAGEANAQQMQSACMFDKKTQQKALDRLVSELLVTALRRDVTIYENWCTFCYGPAERWESKQSAAIRSAGAGEAAAILSGLCPEEQIKKLLK